MSCSKRSAETEKQNEIRKKHRKVVLDTSSFLDALVYKLHSVINNEGFNNFTLSPCVLNVLKQLSPLRVMKYISNWSDEIEPLRALLVTEEYQSAFKELNKFHRTQTIRDFVHEVNSPYYNPWILFWTIFSHPKIDSSVFSVEQYLKIFSCLWLHDPYRFIVYALLALHHCKGPCNACWPECFVTLLLMPFNIEHQCCLYSDVKQLLQNSLHRGNLYDFYRKIRCNSSLLDTFYMRFNGGSYNHKQNIFLCSSQNTHTIYKTDPLFKYCFHMNEPTTE